MRVRATHNLKNSSVKDKFPGGMISEGTIFEGEKGSLPDFIFGELERKSGNFEILPDLKKKRGRKPKPIPAEPAKPKDKSGFVSNEPKKKSTSLREKLTKTEK
jgi:hypothetical protein